MENRVYYGEYSLEHWINLILKKNIILPNYQRLFVWNEKKVTTLIDTFKKKQFVPPVTIGSFKSEGTNQNLILDGQQRLTSILLAYLGLFPDKKEFKNTLKRFADERDESEEKEEEVNYDNILEWNINELTKKGNDKHSILSVVRDGNYTRLSVTINDEFLRSTFLGFSYLVPQVTEGNEQQNYYSSVFRNINIQGEPLLAQESRKALYFLDDDLVPFFVPEFSKTLVVKMISSEAKADFVRYLSLLSQYHHHQENSSSVARGFKPKMEKFYENYIYASINNEDSTTYGKFSNIIPNKNYQDLFILLEQTLDSLEIPREYPSIIDLDIYLFGIIYHTIFKKKLIDLDKKVQLRHALENEIEKLKRDDSHRRSPNNLGHLRHRISKSTNIYGRFIQ